MQSLPTMICPGCGTSLPVDPLQETVTCLHCARACAVPSALRARAAAYVARVRTLWADALEAQRDKLLHRHAAAVTPRFWRWFALFALSAPVAVLAPGLASRLPLGTTILVLLTLGLIGYRFMGVLVDLLRLPSVGMVIATGLGECPRCGAPVNLLEGKTRAECGHCHATVLTTPEIERAQIAAALERARKEASAHDVAMAEHVRVASDARAAFGVGGSISTVVTVLLVLGSFGLTGAFIAVMLTRPAGPSSPWVCPVLSFGALAMLAWFGLALRRVRREARAFEAVIGRKRVPRRRTA